MGLFVIECMKPHPHAPADYVFSTSLSSISPFPLEKVKYGLNLGTATVLLRQRTSLQVADQRTRGGTVSTGIFFRGQSVFFSSSYTWTHVSIQRADLSDGSGGLVRPNKELLSFFPDYGFGHGPPPLGNRPMLRRKPQAVSDFDPSNWTGRRPVLGAFLAPPACFERTRQVLSAD